MGSLSMACSSGGETRPGEDVSLDEDAATDLEREAGSAVVVRVATFNASLHRTTQGELADDLAGGGDEQARQVAEILQRQRPDVVLINEFDWDADEKSAEIFEEEYLAVGQGGAEALDYEYRYVPETNTGEHSGVDLNDDGQVVSTPGSQAYGDDAFGFGVFPGQYGMVIYSRYPIAEDDIRTFRTLLWKAMPDNLMPTDWYSDEAVEVFRLSSKNHVDVPVDVDGRRLHLLASHPTPPAFDGPEQRNVRRNNDEIRFWVDYISGSQAPYIEDDTGTRGALETSASFVVVGDLNNDPNDGDGRQDALDALLDHQRVQDPRPQSDGARQAGQVGGGANDNHDGDPGLDTADFNNHSVGNLRVDYVLPSADLSVEGAGVFWPDSAAEHAGLAEVSDHRLVWVDVTLD
jgi:hypothetical protein